MSKARVSATRLSFSWPDGTPVLSDLSFSLGPSRIGLVAPNGAGKSTLLKLLAGHLKPTSGSIETEGEVGYLPQHAVPAEADARVADALGIRTRLSALDAVLSGDASPALFDAVDGDWDLRERSIAVLSRLGLDDVPMDRPLATLSGGEAMSLALAAQWLRRPGTVLLDEPTNHLDRHARLRFQDMLAEWPGCVLIASHDRELLRAVDGIAELTSAGLRLHGGGFDLYADTLETERHADEQRVRALRNDVRREQRERQLARERSERRAGKAARTLSDAGLPRIVAGNRARNAQVAAGKAGAIHAQRLAVARRQWEEVSSRLDAAAPVDFALPATRVPRDQIVVAVKGLRIAAGERMLFGDGGLDLTLRGPERVALVGDNGTGKTSLLRVLAGLDPPGAGTLHRGPGRVAYLSQRLDLLDPASTLAENLAGFVPDMPDGERANLLARLRFRGDRMRLPASALSGGERLRAVLACVLHASPAPRLLLLDEPTNNLDIESVAQLETALNAYEGAMVVVSHDIAFLDAIGLTRRLALTRTGLRDIT